MTLVFGGLQPLAQCAGLATVLRDTCTITVRSKGRCGSTEPTDTQDTHGQDLQVIVVMSRKLSPKTWVAGCVRVQHCMG
jgi:hypothetical protein